MFGLIAFTGQVLPEENAAGLLWLAGGLAIPAAVGVAVSRYRLFGIDDAERVIGEFAESLRHEVDNIELVKGWVDVAETMQPSTLGVWLRS